MGLEPGKSSQLPAVAWIETDYLDTEGNPTNPEAAVRVITRKYDSNGNYILATVSIDFSKK